MRGRVSEIFLSIQGEGPYLGQRQVFVRLANCNLNCKYCDTKIDSFREYESRELLAEIKLCSNNCYFVSFTGGEPLLQKDFLKEILPLTREAGFKNYLETNGTLPQALGEVIDNLDIVAMDFKLPSSTETGSFWPEHRRFLEISSKKEVFVKIVINESTVESDLIEAIKIIKEVNPGVILVLQPDSSEDYFRIEGKIERFKDICFKENIAASIIPQAHKMAGVR